MELTEALASAFDTAQADTGTTQTEVTTESTTPETGRARDEAGRFAKIEAKAPVQAEPTQPTQEQVQEFKSRAPSSWKKDVVALWDKADRGEPLTAQEIKAIQDEALRREGDFHKGIENWRSNAERAKQFDQVVAPYQQTFQKLGIDAQTAVGELLKADHTLRNAPPTVKFQKILEIANAYGVDLSQQFNPDVAKYEAELFATRQRMEEMQRQQEMQTMASLNSEIEAFRAGADREHFEDVREDMAALLYSGRAKNLEEAYDMAVYANPKTRQALLQQQTQQAAAGAQAQRAKAAAVSVRGSSPASVATTAAQAQDRRSAIAAAFDSHS